MLTLKYGKGNKKHVLTYWTRRKRTIRQHALNTILCNTEMWRYGEKKKIELRIIWNRGFQEILKNNSNPRLYTTNVFRYHQFETHYVQAQVQPLTLYQVSHVVLYIVIKPCTLYCINLNNFRVKHNTNRILYGFMKKKTFFFSLFLSTWFFKFFVFCLKRHALFITW